MDEIPQRHRAELKALQNDIQKIKKSVPKGDKKRFKEAQETIIKLEEETRARHKNELGDIHLINDVASVKIDAVELTKPKISKGKKKKKKCHIDADNVVLKYEKSEEISERLSEMTQIVKQLKALNLQLVEMPADGNCMFNAVAFYCINKSIFPYSIEFNKSDEAAVALRSLVFEELIRNQNKYEAFVTTEEKDYEQYCEEIRSTRAWGGNVELKALSHCLRLPIRIIQADVAPIIIEIDEEGQENGVNREDEGSSFMITITYHKFALGLGEHYNACTDQCQSNGDIE